MNLRDINHSVYKNYLFFYILQPYNKNEASHIKSTQACYWGSGTNTIRSQWLDRVVEYNQMKWWRLDWRPAHGTLPLCPLITIKLKMNNIR